jgi:hypothetical protein
MPVNRTLEALRTHREAKRSTSDAQLRQLALDDLGQLPPKPDANGVVLYGGERAIARALRGAEEQKLYWRTETITAGLSALVFLGIAAAIALTAYFGA